jgi:protein-tyrosine phosphatase
MFVRWRRWQRRRRPNLPPNAAPITSQLVVGGFIDVDDWQQLVELGVSVVVSLQAERHDEDAFGEIQPDGYLRLPTIDHTAPTLAQLRMGAAFIDEAVRSGKRVLVHCHAGIGRSTLLCTCYLIYAGMSVEEAWQTVKQKRPIAHLNGLQRSALDEFATTIQQERAAVSVPVDGPTPDTHIFGAQT